jgi:hypothetical protein
MVSRRCRGVDPAQFVYFVGISKRTLARVDSLARSPRSLAPSPSRPLTACRSSAGVASNEQRASKQARKRESTGSPPSQPIQTFPRSTWSKRGGETYKTTRLINRGEGGINHRLRYSGTWWNATMPMLPKNCGRVCAQRVKVKNRKMCKEVSHPCERVGWLQASDLWISRV